MIHTEYILKKYNDNLYDILILNKKTDKTIDNKTKKIYTNKNYLRTKRKVREIALSNDFQYFVTLTVSPKYCERSNLDTIICKIRLILKKYKRKNKDFSYLLIAEMHKDNTNYHFHGLMKGINENDIYINRNGYLSNIFFDEIGFNSFDKIKHYEKTCNYITKYISKNICKISSGHSYFHSRGLKIPETYKLKPFDINFLKNYNFFENEYLKKIQIDINKLDTKDLYKLINICEESEDLYYERKI